MKELLEKLDLIIEQTNSSDVVLAALIGALAAVIPQFLFWVINKRQEKKNSKLEIKAELHRLQHLIKDHYRELAMHKAHKSYWYALYEDSKIEKKEEKFYASHLTSSANVRLTELKLSETFSQFYKLVIKFQHLTMFDDKIGILVNEYYDYIPGKPDKINLLETDLMLEEAKQETRLRKEYENYDKIIDKIVRRLNKV